jgi:hypothetical protein
VYVYNTYNPSFPPPSSHLCTYWNSVAEEEDDITTGLEDTGQINLCYGCMSLMFSMHIEVLIFKEFLNSHKFSKSNLRSYEPCQRIVTNIRYTFPFPKLSGSGRDVKEGKNIF